jgi:hypothetical protein
MATATSGYTLLDTLAPEILQYCNSAPTIMVRTHIINTTIEFCQKTLLLKKKPSNVTLEEDVHEYTLKFPGNRYRTIAIDSCKFEGDTTQPLIRTTEKEMDGEFVNWRDTKNSQPTRYYLKDGTNKIGFWPVPKADIDTDLVIRAIVTYKRDQTEIDEFVYEKWHEVIQAGVIAKMLLINGATWFNPQLAPTFARAYSRGVREGRKTTVSGTGKYPGRVIPQSYNVVGSNAGKRGGQWV